MQATLGLALLLAGASAAQPVAPPTPAGFRDDFAADPSPAYTVAGAVTWRKGAVTLGKDAVLRRPVAVGHTAEVRAVVRWPRGRADGEVRLRLAGGPGDALVGLRRVGGKVVLVNLAGPPLSAVLGPAPAGPPGAEETWTLLLQVSAGLARAKAWPREVRPPPDWHIACSRGDTAWQPESLEVQGGPGGALLQGLTLNGLPPLRPSAEEQEELRRARALNREVVALYRQRRYAEALPKALEALALRRRVLPACHPDVAQSLHNVGAQLKYLKRLREARPYYEQALAAYRDALPPDHRQVAVSLHTLAHLYEDLGQLERARPLLEQAVAVPRKLGATQNVTFAESLGELGVLHALKGEWVKCASCWEEALAVRRKILPAEHPDLLQNLTVLGLYLRVAGKYDRAAQYLEEALAGYRKRRPPPAKELVHTLDLLGSVHSLAGRWEQARACFDEAVDVARKALPEHHPYRVKALTDLGSVLLLLGRPDEARACLEQALTVLRKTVPSEDLALTPPLEALGDVLRDLRQYREARACLEEALRIHEKQPPGAPWYERNLANCLVNLGVLLKDMGRHEEARARLEEALVLNRKLRPPDSLGLANNLQILATVLARTGKPDQARPHLEEALALTRRVLSPSSPRIAANLNDLGATHENLGKYREARAAYEEALAINGKALPPQHPHLVSGHTNLAYLLCEMGEPEAAWRQLTLAVPGGAEQVARLSFGSAQRDHAALAARQRERLDLLLGLAEELGTPSAAQLDLLMTAVLQGRATSAAAVRLRQEAVAVGKDGEAVALLGRLHKVRRQLADLLVQGVGRQPSAEYRGLCERLRRQEDELERTLARRVTAYAELRRADRAGPADVAARLAEGTVLVELVRYRPFEVPVRPGPGYWGKGHYAGLLLWRAGGAEAGPRIRLVPLGPAAGIDWAVHAWRAAVQKGHTPAPLDRELRGRLWEPLARALPAGTGRLVVAPDGELALVPFEAIRLADGKYLVERLQVSYVAGGRDLLPRPLPEKASGLAVVLADPDYEALGGDRGPPAAQAGGAGKPARSPDVGRRRLHFARLPGFAREADAAAGLLKGRPGWDVRAARGAAAAEEALTEFPRPRLLYLITHGFFLPDAGRGAGRDGGLRELELVDAGPLPAGLPSFADDPRLRSGLALAGANRWKERADKGLSDGLLTALEVEDLDLWGTELVVLSACETALGEVQVGEGVLGLRRAFQLAGARTVLASLWKVPDRETEQLMAGFFGRWLQGAGKAEALRQAQLGLIRDLRQSGDPRLREAPPLYWAAFVCHGQVE
jgi:CHAT domain-containing protein/tetratricopeptide (TPR) repeat protein